MEEEIILLTNTSVVLATGGHPPSVTHDFLLKHKVIPEDFQIQGTPFYAPPISQIKYNNGFCIVTEPNRISLQFLKATAKIEEQKVCLETLNQTSLNYVQFFSDIKCQSIGINFQMIRDDLAFQSFIEQTLKSDSPFLVFEDIKGDVKTLNSSYNWRGKQLNMIINKVQKQEINRPSQLTDVVLFNFNFSYPNNYYSEGSVVIKELKENFEKSQQFIRNF